MRLQKHICFLSSPKPTCWIVKHKVESHSILLHDSSGYHYPLSAFACCVRKLSHSTHEVFASETPGAPRIYSATCQAAVKICVGLGGNHEKLVVAFLFSKMNFQLPEHVIMHKSGVNEIVCCVSSSPPLLRLRTEAKGGMTL